MLIQMYKIASWTLLPDTSFLAIVYYDQASWTVPALAIHNTKAKVNEAEVKGLAHSPMCCDEFAFDAAKFLGYLLTCNSWPLAPH